MAASFAGILRSLAVAKKATGIGQGIRTEVRATRTIVALEKLTDGVKHREKINRQLGIQLYGWVIRNFDSGGKMQTPPWAPLAESTKAQKARLGYSGLPLIRTGNLRQSFAPFSDNDEAGVGAKASFGVDYAQVHEQGSGNVPARPMLPPKEYALKSATTIYQLEIERLRKETGL